MSTFYIQAALYLLMNLLWGSAYAQANNINIPSLMRAGHSIPSSSSMEMWLLIDSFDPSFDIIDYAKKLGDSAKPSQMLNGRIGVNIRLDEHWLLRSELMYGKQTVVRKKEPKITHSTVHTESVILQWHNNTLPLVLEAGYSQATYPPSGFSVYQLGNSTLTAAPGKLLIESSEQASSWMVKSNYPLAISDTLLITLGAEYQASKLQANYLSYDPAIQSLAKKQAPQSTPWYEKQTTIGFGMDYSPTPKLTLAFDFKQVDIKRSNYIPRQGFEDYNSTQIIDTWLFYHSHQNITFILRAHANTHYLLGENPAAYNRRINHKFKHPFGFLTIGLTYQY